MTITGRKELLRVLTEDAKANRRFSLRAKLFGDEIWKYILRLRKCEYYEGMHGLRKLITLPSAIHNKFVFHRLAVKCGFTIFPGCVDEGFSIAHRGTIVINGNCRIGKNFRVHEGVTIGTTGGSDIAPIIGNNVFVGAGAKIIGAVEIADDVAIGANAVVVKSIKEQSTTWAGVPATIISDKSSHSNLSDMLDFS